MDLRLLLKILGVLLILFSFSVLPPILVAVIYGNHHELPTFVTTFFIVMILGLAFWLPLKNYQRELRVREGFIIVTFFWVVFSALAAIPFMLSDSLRMSFTDAYFEAMSGFTTTGATVITGLDHLPHSILFYRNQLQWLGGMGIIVLAVAILPILGVGGMGLFKAEAPGPIKDAKLTPRIAGTAKVLYLIYMVVTVLCALSYWAAGMTPFDAIAHSFSTVANGGFSTHDESFTYFNSPVLEGVGVFFMALSGVNFALHYRAWHSRSLKAYWQDTEFRAYFWILLAASLAVSGILIFRGSLNLAFNNLHHGTFQLVSFMTTSGYAVADFANWPGFIPVLLVLTGFVGGCAGSTAGGLKVVRVVLLVKQSRREVARLIHPNAQLPIMLGDREVDERVLNAVWGFFGLYVVSFAFLMLLMMHAGADHITAFSAVAACINNVGPGLGDVATSFTTMNSTVKWLGSFAMLLGRLEIFTVLVLFSPTFWRS